VRFAGIPTLDGAVVERTKIPLPPLPVQQEIVRILDNFTELTAELTARRKQYEYYRDLLLTFGDEELQGQASFFYLLDITRGNPLPPHLCNL
jgi:restriction endonuclease S subunit